MNGNSKRWKRWARGALAAVLALDAVLLLVSWRAATPQGQLERREKLRMQHALLSADIRRAANIRQRLPDVQLQCDRFFADQLLEAATGYSAVVADLDRIASRAGLRRTAINFKQHELEKRAIIAVSVSTTVEGDYPSLIRFINGLERSANFYLMDSLTLASSAGGSIKLNLELRTYFRS